MQHNCLIADSVQLLEQLIRLDLLLYEDQNTAASILKVRQPLAEDLDQSQELLRLFLKCLYVLVNVRTSLAAVADNDLDRLVEDSLRQ